MTNSGALGYYDREEIWSADGNYASDEETRRARFVADLVTEVEPAGVLDVGAGNGIVSNLLHDAGIPIVALDFSEVALAAVRGETVVGRVDSLPFPERSFHTVLMSEVLEHLGPGEYEAGIAEAARVADRFIVLTVPNHENLYATAIVCPQCGCRSSPHRHVRSFRPGHAQALVPGFAPRRVVEFGPVDPRASTLEALVRREVLRRWHWVPTAICPQCGYAAPNREQRTSAQSSARRRTLRRFRSRLSPRRIPRWLGVVLERT